MINYRSCNFCGGTTFKVFKRLDLRFPKQIYGDAPLTYPDVGKELKLQYLECVSCGLVGINPLTVFADIDKHTFDGERNIVAWADLDYEVYAADKLRTTAILYEEYEFERYRRTNRVLDVSCGPGVGLSWLRDENGWEPYGIDPDRHSVRTARERYGLEIANGLIGDVAAPDEHFDIVVFDNALEHTFDPLGALLRAFRLLRKGGMLFVLVPNADSLHTRVANGNAYWGHWFFYRAQVLASTLGRIGFDVRRVVAVQHTIHPDVVRAVPDLATYEEGLRVALPSEEEIRFRLPRTTLYADYFTLAAVKPESAGVCAAADAELRSLAASSMIERRGVEIVGALPRFERLRPPAVARAWRVLRREGVRTFLATSERHLQRLVKRALERAMRRRSRPA
jgi:2-polyprenyl-3-methyl-5-hydroxy-6-metoxy-1,4-benzoquinol methylase